MLKGLLLVTGLALSHVALSSASTTRILGEAFDLESNQLVYTEEHQFAEDKHTVVYREPGGTVFANKNLDYSSSGLVPDVNHQNKRIDEAIDLRKVGNGYLEASYIRGDKRINKTATLALEKNMVADAGFNSYVLENWQRVVAGETAQFKWFVPSRLKPITLKLKHVECKEVKEGTCFTLTPKSWIIGLALQPIKLTYISRSLVRYEGRSNIVAASGEYHKVRIEYSYMTR